MHTRIAPLLAMILAAGLAATPLAQAQPPTDEQLEAYQQLVRKVQEAPAGASDADARKLAQMARRYGRPYAASVALKSYLARNFNPSPELLRLAAANAMDTGDYTAAVSRYRGYLEAARGDDDASDAAAKLYTALVDFVGSPDGAYQFMSSYGAKFRKTPAARRFDSWFLREARRRKDYAAAAEWLVEVLKTRYPLPQERLHFWDDMDWLMHEISEPEPKKYPALPHLKKLLPLVRESRNRTLRYTFYVANLGFHASSAGKDAEQLGKDMDPVVAAAKAWFDAEPTADTLTEILRVLGGGNFDVHKWNEQGAPKRELFMYAFNKLNNQARDDVLRWHGDANHWVYQHALPAEQWTELAARVPEFFENAEITRHIRFVETTTDPGLYKREARFLKGVPSSTAAVVNSMAAGGDDLTRAVDHLVKQESWYLGFTSPYRLLRERMWPTFQNYPRDEKNALPADYWPKVINHFGASYVVKTPIALFDADAAADYVHTAWTHGGKDDGDKTYITGVLSALDWVPYTAEQRKQVFGGAYGQFKKWAESTRQTLAERTKARDAAVQAVEETTKAIEDNKAAVAKAQQAKAKAEGDAAKKLAEQITSLQAQAKQLAEQLKERQGAQKQAAEALQASEKIAEQFTPLEKAFQRAMDPKTGDPNKAPDALSKQLALAVVALREGKEKPFLDAARNIYKQVRDFESGRQPFGWATMHWIMTPREKPFSTWDFQMEVVADQVKSWRPGGNPWTDWRIQAAVGRVSDRDDWYQQSWSRIPGNTKDRAKQANRIFGDALIAQIDKGQLWGWLFDMYRRTRGGHGWNDHGMSLDVMSKLIDSEILLKTGYRPVDGIPPAAASYMYILRREFQPLEEKYPLGSAFDEMLVKEAEKTRYLDRYYWNEGGSDPKRVVRNAAAKIIAGFDRLPFGYADDQKAPVYRPHEFWDWQGRATSADEKVADAMMAKVESLYGKTRFDSYAMGRDYFARRASVETPEARKECFSRLKTYLARAAASPARAGPPRLNELSKFEKADQLTDEEIKVLVGMFPETAPTTWPAGWGVEHVVRLLLDAMDPPARGRDAEALRLRAQRLREQLYGLAPHFWKVARDCEDGELYRRMIAFGRKLMDDEQYDLATSFSSAGLEVVAAALPSDARTSLMLIRSKSLVNVGGVITVDRSDPRYPAFAAQAAYLTGKPQTAWEQYLANRALVARIMRDLDPTFILWLIDKNIESNSFDAAESLARDMMQWVDSMPEGFDPELRARLLLSYADISFAREEFPRAKAQYERIASAKEFDATRAQADAGLRIAEVDRLTNNYDQAIDRLEKLTRRDDKYLQTEAYYQLARVHFDREEYGPTQEALAQVFTRSADHADARILQGKVFLKVKKLMEATELRIGLATSQRFIVPGKPLKVHLEDRNLSVVGKSSDIEIRAWTASGDEELFSLLPFGDSKTKFEGQVPTEMAPLKKGDHVLQVLGGDEVHYDFSPAFRKSNKIQMDAPETLRVVTDAELLASSGRILSKEERELRAMERMIRQRLKMESDVKIKEAALSTVRNDDQVKPGNPINIRVIDPDRATTPDKDALSISVTAASGDRIGAFTLTETETHSGVFEGAVPTSSGQAVAYAGDSKEGVEPNFAISAGDHGAWIALPDGVRPKTFTVDLNDNVALGEMVIESGVPGRGIKDFIVRTSLNGRDFDTVGRWPKAHKPWDGRLMMEIIRYAGATRPPANITEFRSYLDSGYLGRNAPRVVTYPETIAANWNNNPAGKAGEIGLQWDGKDSWYIAHFRGAFYLDRRQVRTFMIDHHGKLDNVKYVLSVDGEAGEDPYTIKRSLAKGVHTVDVYLSSQRRNGTPQFELMTDADEPPYTQPCPPEMFDVGKHPEIREAILTPPAEVDADEDETTFTVAFPERLRARVIRLVMVDFETDAPAINSIRLTDAHGEKVLPTEQNFLRLRQNQTLEVVPGDRLTIAYEDPSVISQNKRSHEAFMTATFHNAEINATFVQYELGRDGVRIPEYIPMRRFKPGDTINVLINDPDLDVSDEHDELTFTVQTYDTAPREIRAMETEAHSGVFLARLQPIRGESQRPTEIPVREGEDILLSYMDAENTDPGVPWARTAHVEQVWYQQPELRVYDVESHELPPEQVAAAAEAAESVRHIEDYVPVRRSLVATRPESVDDEEPATMLIGCPMLVEVLWPTIAQSPVSTAELYVQTSSGREKAGAELADDEFDVNVPGTLKLRAAPSAADRLSPPAGYRQVVVRGDRYASEPLDDGRFTFRIPAELGSVPETTLVNEEYDRRRGEDGPTLSIRGGDTIYVGFKYTDPENRTHWAVRTARVDSDVFFDVMERRYQKTIDALHVGEEAFLRVIHRTRDLTDEKDTLTVGLATESGVEKELELTETFGHSGVFKGPVRLAYKGDEEMLQQSRTLAVDYGDAVTAAYAAPQREPVERTLAVHKGADGNILPFTKRFKDPEIAVQTQFTIAEAYFELAKRHRELNQESLARREIAQGKKLLEEAIRDYPNTEHRAQAEYLLANLSYEFANDARNEEDRKRHFMEAAARFSDLVATYPDSAYAPKSQYKKAQVFEKMGKIDQACEEYVKLSYRYPDNELVAETIAQLGRYFLGKGQGFDEAAEKETDPVEKEKILVQGREMYRTAAQVFGRLAPRFPQHKLAGKTTVLSAQCYMQAEEFDDAIEVFESVIADPEAENDLVAESMFWCGECYYKMGDMGEAYQMYKKCTWDYPESKWAKYSRGRLMDEKVAKAGERQ